jgi:hypothetical protein
MRVFSESHKYVEGLALLKQSRFMAWQYCCVFLTNTQSSSFWI